MQSLKELIRFMRPYRKWAILAPLFMVLEVAMDLLQPALVERIVDEGIANLDLQLVVNTGWLMMGVALIGVIGGMGCTFFAVKAAEAFGADLRGTLFRKVQSLSFSNLDKLHTGELVTRLTNDVVQIKEVARMIMQMMVRAPFTMIGSFAMAIVTSPKLSWILLVLMPIELVFVIFVVRKSFPLFSIVQKNLDKLNTVLQENLMGVRVVKAFVQMRHERNRFETTNESLKDITVKASRIAAVAMPLMGMAVNLGIVAVVWFGGIDVQQGDMQVGQIIAFVNYLTRAMMSLVMVAMLVMRLARAQASAIRVSEVLDSEPDIVNSPDALTDFSPTGHVVFDNVSFSYDGDQGDPVLKGVSFDVEPGQTVAILGTTGAGKSSLVHLIPRFYDVTGGCVTIDGVDVRDVNTDVLRRKVSVALQEPILFTGTIRDNIRYGRPEASQEEVEHAARMAQAHDFIISFPEGYDTEVGQRGVNLSGGQKQRLSIARALLTKPAVLVLDDSTSSVDVETEGRIQEALASFMKEMTSFVIAQRISTVLNADKILVLDDGMVAAEGTHDELLDSSPIYREIFESQLSNGAMANV